MGNSFIPKIVTRDIPYIFTKQSRKQFVSEGRRANEDESFQKWYIRKYLGIDIGSSTNLRCNLSTGQIQHMTRVMHLDDCHLWTEDFDGSVKQDNSLWSLKMIPEAGGAQTRSIREVMHHIDACVKNITVQGSNNNFVFVLDGETILKYKDRMINLIPKDIRHRFIIGPVREVVETYEQKKRTWTILHN